MREGEGGKIQNSGDYDVDGEEANIPANKKKHPCDQSEEVLCKRYILKWPTFHIYDNNRP